MTLLQQSRRFVLALLLTSAAAFFLAPRALADDGDKFAAIAFSQSTGSYGYGYGFDARSGAENEALAQCSGDDAKVVVWVKNGWCALAVGDDNAYGYGWAEDLGTARKIALAECRKRTTNSRVVICVSHEGKTQK